MTTTTTITTTTTTMTTKTMTTTRVGSADSKGKLIEGGAEA
jgi:hypothetical protein